MRKRIVFIAAGALLLVGLIGAFLFGPVLIEKQKKYVSTDFTMGSILTTTHWGHDPAWKVSQRIRELERELTNATEAPLLAIEIMEASDGAFDPYLGALVKLWNINDEPYLPSPEEISEALQRREVDLGAYGKGAACDMALKVSNVPAVISLGGNIMTYGKKPWGQPFKIALRDPRGGPNDTMGVFTLRGTNFISTSGSYEKFFERDGKRYHHIFDPQTGYPAEREPGLVSVTVITRGGEAPGALGDMISTACFVLGYGESQDLLKQYNCDALFIYEDCEVRAAGHVKEYFKLDNTKYHWSEA